MSPESPANPESLTSSDLEEYILSFTRLASLGLLSSGVMHDVRNALTVLSGNVQILQMKGERATHDELRLRLEKMMIQIERMEHMIGRVESYSRRIAGVPRLNFPAALLDNALLAIEHSNGGTLPEIRQESSPLLKQVFGDPSLLEFIVVEMFRHLLSQYQEGVITVSSTDHHPYWELQVEIPSPEDSRQHQLTGVSPGIEIARLAARKVDGLLTSVDNDGIIGWRLHLPWRIESPDSTND